MLLTYQISIFSFYCKCKTYVNIFTHNDIWEGFHMKALLQPAKRTFFFLLFLFSLTYFSASYSQLIPQYSTLFLPNFPLGKSMWLWVWIGVCLLLGAIYFFTWYLTKEKPKTSALWFQSFLLICYPYFTFYKQWYLFAFAWVVLAAYRMFIFSKHLWKKQLTTFVISLFYLGCLLYFIYLNFGIYWYNG